MFCLVLVLAENEKEALVQDEAVDVVPKSPQKKPGAEAVPSSVLTSDAERTDVPVVVPVVASPQKKPGQTDEDRYLCELCDKREVDLEIPVRPISPSPCPSTGNPVVDYYTLLRDDGVQIRRSELSHISFYIFTSFSFCVAILSVQSFRQFNFLPVSPR